MCQTGSRRAMPCGSGSLQPASAAPWGELRGERVPRSDLGKWDPTLREFDVVGTLAAQNARRLRYLVPIRWGRMATSPWTFYRGAAAVMAADLATRPHTGINVQLCGDAHVLNFGLWATPERNLSFDLRDFDETLPGPFEWDVSRLVASLVVLARDNGVDAAQGRGCRCSVPAVLPHAHGAVRNREAARHLV